MHASHEDSSYLTSPIVQVRRQRSRSLGDELDRQVNTVESDGLLHFFSLLMSVRRFSTLCM